MICRRMRKFSAHYIFPVNRLPLKYGILFLDDEGRVIDLIDTGGKLKEEANLEFYPGILLPGFVNTHCHLELSHLLNCFPQKTGMSDFLDKVTMQRETDKEIIHKAIRSAAEELYRSGTSVVGDIVNTSDTVPVKVKSSVHWHSFIELFGLRPENADKIWQKGKELKQRFENSNLSASISPHAPYSVSRQLWKHFNSCNQELLSMHSQESLEEEELMSSRKGKMADWFTGKGFDLEALPPEKNSSLMSVMDFLPEFKSLLLVHNTHTRRKDIESISSRFKKDQIFWVMCPKSNLFIEDKLPEDLIVNRKGLNLCLGTDSLASNNSLSLLEEIKTLQKYFPAIELEELVKWSTLNGAKALGVDETYGSFETGKMPGVVWIRNFDYPGLKLSARSRSVRLV